MLMLNVVRGMMQHRHLVWEMTKREVSGRYRGSFLGMAWSLFNPLLMLAVYTFVFSVVFKSRWGVAGEFGQTEFSVLAFTGMIVHGLFAEVVTRAPSLITSNVNFVKKVIFPLEILPVIALAVATFHFLISLLVLVGAILIFHGGLHWTIVLLPVVLFPFATLVLGLAWFLASLGTFVRDIGQAVGILTTVLLFLSPVFFPLSALPESYQAFVLANPMTFIIEQCRAVAIWGVMPDWVGLGLYTVAATSIAVTGLFWFQKTRKGFADVL